MEFTKAFIIKWTLVFLIFATCIGDIATFFWSGLYEFEINPLVLMLKGAVGFSWAIAIALIFKCSLIAYIGIMNAWYKPKPDKTHFAAYTMVYIGIFCILIQAFGIYSNINTTIAHTNDPVNVQPLSIEQSTQLLSTATTIFYVMTFISLLSFWIYENIHRLKSNPLPTTATKASTTTKATFRP
jgi:hypothetical protein